MAKPNQTGRFDQRKADPTKDQDQEKDEDAAEKEAPEAEQNKAQNTVGNAALAAHMIGSGATDGGGDGGGGGGLSMRKAGQDQDKDYGGDGAIDDDVPLTLEDLTRSWNPGTHKTQDRPSWLEPMPSDELPPEDADFLRAIREDAGRIVVQGGFTVDSQIQPSTGVVAASLLDWTRGVKRFVRGDLFDRAVCHAIVPPASFLQDPDGRVLLARGRTGAIGTWLLHRTPLLAGAPRTADLACLGFLLELEGHRRHQEAVHIDPGVDGKQMPRSTTVFRHAYGARSGRLVPQEPTASASVRIREVLGDLLDLEDPHVYVPAQIPDDDTGDDDDEDLDPLGLDAVILEMTGGAEDREAPMFYAAVQSAERLAAATARFRVHTAATAVAVAQVAGLWSTGAPVEALEHVLDTVDQQTDKNLRLLVEVARAAQKRAVPPKGLKAGLTRAARALLQVHGVATGMLGSVIGGILPGAAELPPAAGHVLDGLEDAWLDGNPAHALRWLDGLPPTDGNRAAGLITRACTGEDPAELAAAMRSLADGATDGPLAEILRVMAGPLLLASRAYPEALELARAQMALGVQRRNGMVLANGALLGVEALRMAGRPDEMAALRLEAGRTAWRMGAPSALTLLARWSAPERDESFAAA